MILNTKGKGHCPLKEYNAVQDRIVFIKSSGSMNWIRDAGPHFVSNRTELRAIDFKWNCFGNSYYFPADSRGRLNDELTDSMGPVN